MAYIKCIGPISEIVGGGNYTSINYTTVPNTYIDGGTGAETPYTNWSSTDYIDISEIDDFYVIGITGGYNAWYDSSKTCISTFSVSGGYIAPPSGAKYMRLSDSDANMAKLMLFTKYDSGFAGLPKFTETLIGTGDDTNGITFTDDYHNYPLIAFKGINPNANNRITLQLATPALIDSAFGSAGIQSQITFGEFYATNYHTYQKVDSTTWSRIGSRNYYVTEVRGLTCDNYDIVETKIFENSTWDTSRKSITSTGLLGYDMFVAAGAQDETIVATLNMSKPIGFKNSDGQYRAPLGFYNKSIDGVVITDTTMSAEPYHFVSGIKFVPRFGGEVEPTSNLWGGLQMAIDIIKAGLSSAGASSDYVSLTGSYAMNNRVVVDDIFEANKQYTFILAYENNSVYSGGSVTANLLFKYSDDSYDTFTITNSSANTKYTHAFVSTAGKTVTSIQCTYVWETAKIYYEESGVFEGVKTVNDFEPYNRYNT